MGLRFKPLNYQAGEFEARFPTIVRIYGQFGKIDPQHNTTNQLKFYDLTPLVRDPEILKEFCGKFSAEIKWFSHGEYPDVCVVLNPPNLKKYNYKTGVVWIHDPRVPDGSFKDPAYTEAWRILHEVGHCVVEPFLHSRYGNSKRDGQLGKFKTVTWQTKKGPHEHNSEPVSVRHGQRAIEWESLAFRAQRMLSKDVGVSLSDSGYQKEYNGNISDAIFRVITGQFGNPGEFGFSPHNLDLDLVSIFEAIEDAARQIPNMTADVKSKVFGEIPDLKKWHPITDDVIREAIEACSKHGIGSVHSNWEKFKFYKIPRL